MAMPRSHLSALAAKIPLCPSNVSALFFKRKEKKRERLVGQPGMKAPSIICQVACLHPGLEHLLAPYPHRVAELEIIHTPVLTFLLLLLTLYSPTTDLGLIKGPGIIQIPA